jgi:hypothetical protein
MVRLTKSELPPGVIIKSEQDYRKGEVLKTLANDCYNKCYICEIKPTVINVEHIVPHSRESKLKYEWSNLFLACGHCNSIKHNKYDKILDPTKCDPEEHIALTVGVTESLLDLVQVEALTTDSGTEQTTEMLQLVYNGGSTDMKDIESTNLRNEHLMPNIRRFYQYIINYHKEPDLGYGEKITQEINRSSAFAAFKRKIVRDDPELSLVFAEALR